MAALNTVVECVAPPAKTPATDSRGVGCVLRVIDYMGRVPRSLDYQKDIDENFDRETHAIVRKRHRGVVLGRRAKLHLASILPDVPDDRDTSFLIDSMMQNICSVFFTKGGLHAVLSVLHCEPNPILALMATVHAVNASTHWNVILRDMPSCGGEVASRVTTAYGTVIDIRPVYPIDRGRRIIGPRIHLAMGEYDIVDAVEDVLSSATGFEYIVLGEREPTLFDHNGMEYLTYTHLDTPSSKTMTPHFRCYDINGTISNGVSIDVPQIFSRFICNPSQNVLENLPRVVDVKALAKARPTYAKRIYSILDMILNGRPIECYSSQAIMRAIDNNAWATESDLMSDDKYIHTEYTDTHHGLGPQWAKIYADVFT